MYGTIDILRFLPAKKFIYTNYNLLRKTVCITLEIYGLTENVKIET